MMNILGTTIALALVLAIVGGMIWVIRLSMDDRMHNGWLKDMMDIVSGGNRTDREPDRPDASAAPISDEPFEDVCPACGEPVTHRHAECPSCGLRLQ